MMDYVKRIRDLREDFDKTQTDIANFLDTSQTMYARYERFANEMPIRHLMKLCQYYNVSADYILGFTTQRLPLPKCIVKKGEKAASSSNLPPRQASENPISSAKSGTITTKSKGTLNTRATASADTQSTGSATKRKIKNT